MVSRICWILPLSKGTELPVPAPVAGTPGGQGPPARRAAPRSAARHEKAELAGQPDVVALGPVLGDLAVPDPEDVDRLDLEPPSGRRRAQELAGVRPRGDQADRDP